MSVSESESESGSGNKPLVITDRAKNGSFTHFLGSLYLRVQCEWTLKLSPMVLFSHNSGVADSTVSRHLLMSATL